MFYQLGETRYAHPDFRSYIYPAGYKLYDYYHEYQYHIKKIIGTFNEKTVWDFAGVERPVMVAVLDDGIIWHDDLPESRLVQDLGYNFCDSNAYWWPDTYEFHGMGCAGIIGASHTTDSLQGLDKSSCLISMNPNSRLLSIRIFCAVHENEPDSFVTWASMIATAMDYASTCGADVLSCSWGWPDPNRFNSDQLNETILNIVNNGRNGLGCPVIFAAGNYRVKWGYHVQYPANLECVLAVGGTRLDDSCWEWSQHGEALDIMAPTGSQAMLSPPVWTLDQEYLSGINPYVFSNCPPEDNNYDINCRFGGTSAACPMVAGAASLLIARDSTLTSKEIDSVLRYSAKTDLDWGGSITPPDTLYGYGIVDAFRAMLAITRGDANNDGRVDVGDAVYIYKSVFQYGPAPQPDPLTGDANCNGEVEAGDAVYVINFIFKDGPAPQICFEY